MGVQLIYTYICCYYGQSTRLSHIQASFFQGTVGWCFWLHHYQSAVFRGREGNVLSSIGHATRNPFDRVQAIYHAAEEKANV